MNSLKLILVVAFSTFCATVNAQMFVSGSIGLSASGGSVDDGVNKTDKNSNTAFSFSPAAGYFLSDDMAIGLELSLGVNSTTVHAANESVTTTTGIGVTPFVRYYVLEIDRFSVYGQGNLSITSSSSKTKTGGQTFDGEKSSSIGLSVVPAVSYDITDNIALETSINVLRFGFNHVTETQGARSEKTTNFNIGAGLDNIANTGSIRIGAVYTF